MYTTIGHFAYNAHKRTLSN